MSTKVQASRVGDVTYLALDASTIDTGYAWLCCCGGKYTFSYGHVTPEKCNIGIIPAIIPDLCDKLAGVLPPVKTSLSCYIELPFAGRNMAVFGKLSRICGAFIHLLSDCYASSDQRYEDVTPAAWRSKLSPRFWRPGQKKMDKKDFTKQRIREILDIDVENDNVADAIGILYYALNPLGMADKLRR